MIELQNLTKSNDIRNVINENFSIVEGITHDDTHGLMVNNNRVITIGDSHWEYNDNECTKGSYTYSITQVGVGETIIASSNIDRTNPPNHKVEIPLNNTGNILIVFNSRFYIQSGKSFRFNFVLKDNNGINTTLLDKSVTNASNGYVNYSYERKINVKAGDTLTCYFYNTDGQVSSNYQMYNIVLLISNKLFKIYPKDNFVYTVL